ncbi:transcriptional regulator, LacI family [Desulfocicer vacuolatum DSM 3385]|uniref:Transcriptional regulator, LacI family n=1 Tax=Desulfocicer vacuolatum DSM 3385 TaxID=1121400 RepID=A0A1W2EQA8_9BACT|nr:LacI family DNA-binding transcriptional regulator [Desulfocicer vacuolatum]SMD11436.1 transcriptional regulator, LacI family [Desulfocicer vacuolatum DSM 3385]
MSRVTIKDIASKLGVSAATVSNALNGKAGVGKARRKNIMEIASQMGYQPNAFARNLVNQQSYAIGLIVSSISDPFYPELARGVQEKASELGYCMMLFNTNHSIKVEQNSIETLNARGVDGIILATVLQDDPNIALLEKLRIPFVLVNRLLLDPGIASSIDSVVLDNYRGGYESARHLLRMGHTRITIIAGNMKASTAILRTRGARDAMQVYGISEERYDVVDCGYVMETAYRVAKEKLKEKNIPSAFLCQGDNMALGVREAVCEAGMTIPGDIALLGFDDIEFSSVAGIELTTVSHRQYQMGSTGTELLVDKIASERQAGVTKNIVLEPELIVRKSCGFGVKGYIMP